MSVSYSFRTFVEGKLVQRGVAPLAIISSEAPKGAYFDIYDGNSWIPVAEATEEAMEEWVVAQCRYAAESASARLYFEGRAR